MTALQLCDVRKTFKGKGRTVHALKGISLQLSEGEVFGFVGPNGAGKSTTIKIMLDIINDYDGQVLIHGIPSRNSDARRDVSFLPEAPALYEQFTPLEMLKVALHMNGMHNKNMESLCMQWLDRFSVAHNARRKIRQLSKGNVQRVALAHAMITEPHLLILDEPLSGLDPVGRKDVIDILQEYKKEGGAIFFTSHVLHDVERIADRFGFINEGELVTTREPRDLITKDAGRFIVRYQSSTESLTDGIAIRDNEFEYEVSQDRLPDFLEQINRHQGRLIGITPSVSLERVFFQILQEKQASHGAADT